MIDKSSEILTRLKYAVQSLCTSVSQTYEESPSTLPHLYMHQSDNAMSVTDMENNECGVTPMLEITVYTRDGLASAKKIVGLANDEMLKMGFQRNFGPEEVPNISDTSITRVLCRYRRLICDGDIL